MTGEVREYVTQNYSAVNDYVNHLSRRNHAHIREVNSRSFGEYAKWAAVAFVGAGVGAMLTMLGVSFVIEKPQPEVIEKEVVVKDPIAFKPTIIIQQPNESTDVRRARRAAVKRSSAISSTSEPIGTGQKPVVNFTIFKRIPLNVAGVSNVVVGMAYADNNAVRPSTQWCYISSPNTDGTSTRVSLGYEDSGQPIETPVTYLIAQKIGMNLSDLQRAQKLCAFE
jgi:hypothetical protein